MPAIGYTAEEKVKIFTHYNSLKYAELDKEQHDEEVVQLLAQNQNLRHRDDMRISHSTHAFLQATVSHTELMNAIGKGKRGMVSPKLIIALFAVRCRQFV